MNNFFNNFFNNSFNDSFKRLKATFLTLFKWGACSIVSGLCIGSIGSLFYLALSYVTAFRMAHTYMLFLLPVGGIIIIGLYQLTNQMKNSGTNLVITAIQSTKEIPVQVAPLIFVSTLITHICGGSAGREGAALQIGGSCGNLLSKIFKFDEKDTRIMIMCGMSACFSAIFGTPITASIFSMEVISIGVMYYAALVPCVLSAFIASGVSIFFGIPKSHFSIGNIPELDMINGSKIVVMGVLIGLLSILFCLSLHKSDDLLRKYFKNSYFKIIFSACTIIILTLLLQTDDFLGAGTSIIVKSFSTNAVWYLFLLKMIFTSITLSGGFKGGEIVPTLCVGATFGSFLSQFFGFPPALGAACGMVGLFCGVTNCPLTSLMMAIELFDFNVIHYCLIAIAISYLLSGYHSLYHSQKIVYSKLKTEYINIHAKR